MDDKHFIGVLNSQLLLLKELLNLLEQETVALTDINLGVMETLNQKKEEAAANIETQSAVLRQALSELAAERGFPADIALGNVISLLASKDVSLLHGELNAVAQRVREVAALNREIAERFAETASSSLSLLTRVINQSNMYGASGGYQQRSTGSIMINREA